MSDEQSPVNDPNDYDPEFFTSAEDYEEELKNRFDRLRTAALTDAKDAIVKTTREVIQEFGINLISLKRILKVHPILIEHKETRKVGTYDQFSHVRFGLGCGLPDFDLERDALFSSREIAKLRELLGKVSPNRSEIAHEGWQSAERSNVSEPHDVLAESHASLDERASHEGSCLDIPDSGFSGTRVVIDDRTCRQQTPMTVCLPKDDESPLASLPLASQYATDGCQETNTHAVQVHPEPLNDFSGDSKWDQYLADANELRKDYTREQAHYWRARAVFRYPNKQKELSASQASVHTDISQNACEGMAYPSNEVENWLRSEPPDPAEYDKGQKPWGKTEKQARRSSRLRECVLALSLVYLASDLASTEAEIREIVIAGEIAEYAKEPRLDDSTTKENVKTRFEQKTVTRWLVPLKPWFQKPSEK